MRLVDHAVERAMVAGLLFRPDTIDDVEAVVAVDQIDQPAMRATYEAILRVHRRGDVIGVASIETEMRRAQTLNLVGGVEGLGKLADSYTAAHLVEQYAKRVRTVAAARAMQTAMLELLEDARKEALDEPDEWVDRVAGQVMQAAERSTSIGYQRISEAVMDTARQIAARHRDSIGDVTGISTGLPSLDEITGGLQPGDLVVLAGRPSMGKTTLACNLAIAGDKDEAPALFITLEQPTHQLVERMIVATASVDAQSTRRGKLNETDFHRLLRACETYEHRQIAISDVPRINILQIRSLARRFCRQYGIGWGKRKGALYLDYIGLAEGTKARKGRDYVREQEIAEISRGLKAIAKETGLCVVALAQLNREVDKRADPRPRLSDLRESGAIEQDADVVLFTFRPGYYERDEEKRKKLGNRAEVIVDKQRNGPTGIVRVEFIGWKYLFVEPRQSARGEVG